MTRELTRKTDSPRLPKLSDLDDRAQASVLKAVTFDRLKKEMDNRVIALSSDFPELVEKFLSTRKSIHTARRYRNAIAAWTAWCKQNGIEHPMLAEPMHADLFAKDLHGAAASVNSAISSVSSFYSTLVKWRVIAQTPFVKIARRADDPGQKRIPTAAEVRKILEACG